MGRPQIFAEEQVIDKALKIFWSKGYEGVSTKDLISAMGLSNGSFFNCFGNKKTIYLKTLQRYNALHITALENMLTKEMPFKPKIKNVLMEVVKDGHDGKPNVGCFFFNTSLEVGIDDEEILQLASQIHKRIENSFLAAVAMAIKNGEISKTTDSLQLAQYLYNILNGLRVLLIQAPSKKAAQNIITATLAYLPA